MSKSKGLGDTIEKITTATGIKAVVEKVAAVTGKPIYIAMMKPKKISKRFQNFYDQFNNLGITKELNNSIDNWSYDKLDEVNRIAPIIKEKMKSNGII